jgi:hypothetical protein
LVGQALPYFATYNLVRMASIGGDHVGHSSASFNDLSNIFSNWRVMLFYIQSFEEMRRNFFLRYEQYIS